MDRNVHEHLNPTLTMEMNSYSVTSLIFKMDKTQRQIYLINIYLETGKKTNPTGLHFLFHWCLIPSGFPFNCWYWLPGTQNITKSVHFHKNLVKLVIQNILYILMWRTIKKPLNQDLMCSCVFCKYRHDRNLFPLSWGVQFGL